MNIIKQLLHWWKTRNWVKIEVDPNSMEKNRWYHVTFSVKIDQAGNQFYDFVNFRKLTKREQNEETR